MTCAVITSDLPLSCGDDLVPVQPAPPDQLPDTSDSRLIVVVPRAPPAAASAPAAAPVATAGKERFRVVDSVDGVSEAASLGIIRLDYNYPPDPGDIDCHHSLSATMSSIV